MREQGEAMVGGLIVGGGGACKTAWQSSDCPTLPDDCYAAEYRVSFAIELQVAVESVLQALGVIEAVLSSGVVL